MATGWAPFFRQAMMTTAVLPPLAATAIPVNAPDTLGHDIVRRISEEEDAALKNNAGQFIQPRTSILQSSKVLGIANRDVETSALKERFSLLVHQWKTQRNPTMMASRMVSHPAYRAIIRMGQDAIPFVLQELRQEPDEWFYALAKMSGENPITDAQRGRFDQMVSSWLRWGRENGYIPR